MFDASWIFVQTASASIVVGSHVWVEDSEVAWVDGEVVEVHGEEITIKCTSGETVSAFSAFSTIATKFRCYPLLISKLFIWTGFFFAYGIVISSTFMVVTSDDWFSLFMLYLFVMGWIFASCMNVYLQSLYIVKLFVCRFI